MTAFPDDAVTPSVDVDEWVDDLLWHRRTYRQSKVRWWPEDAVLIATENTGGRHEFTSVGDLAALERAGRRALALADRCQRAVGRSLSDARRAAPEFRRNWADLAEMLDLHPHECSEAVHLAALSDPGLPDPAPVTPVLRMCEGFLFTSPLLTAWELKQIWNLYAAGAMVLEDTLVDLLIELDGVAYSDDVAAACGMLAQSGVADRIERHLEARGERGDPRRAARQTYLPLAEVRARRHA